MKVSEIYTSIQGEGPNVGDPTTFVRFGGCNLRCPGWGEGLLPDGTTVPGCDTVFAVYPQWRHSWETLRPAEVVQRIRGDVSRICITGGEPLIQPAKELVELVHTLRRRGHVFDLFTNGTRIIPEWALDRSVTVVMDYKLQGSGEGGKFLEKNFDLLQPGKDVIKFVCANQDDFYEAEAVIRSGHFPDVDYYFGVAWGKMSYDYLIELMHREDLNQGRVNVQIHKHMWAPDERRR